MSISIDNESIQNIKNAIINKINTLLNTHNADANAHTTAMAKKVNIAQGNTAETINKNVVTNSNGNITLENKPFIPTKVDDLGFRVDGILTDDYGINIIANDIVGSGDITLLDNKLRYNNDDGILYYFNSQGVEDEVATLNDIPTLNVPVATTSQSGIVQLSDSISSSSTTMAATANAVKTAYNIGNHSHSQFLTSSTASSTYVSRRTSKYINFIFQDENNNDVSRNLEIDKKYNIILSRITYGNQIYTSTNSISLTVDRGHFLEGEELTPVQDITLTSDENGVYNVQYVADEWGIATFKCENTETQTLTTGWKQVQAITPSSSVGKIYVYSDGRYARLEYNVGSAITPSADNAPFDKNIASINSKYYPAMDFVSVTATPTSPYVCNAYLSKSNGYIHINKFQGASGSSVYVRVNMFYPLNNPQW